MKLRNGIAMMKTALGSLAGLCLLMVVTLQSCDRNEDLAFEDFDKNDNGFIEKDEFRQVFTKNYNDDWTMTDDRGLNDRDFYTYTYRVVDLDGDDQLARNEWDDGYTYYYGSYIDNDFDRYDMDRDNYISMTEYTVAFRDTDYFDSWDTNYDSYLDEEEIANGVYEHWDMNNNNMVNRQEFNSFDNYYAGI